MHPCTHAYTTYVECVETKNYQQNENARKWSKMKITRILGESPIREIEWGKTGINPRISPKFGDGDEGNF